MDDVRNQLLDLGGFLGQPSGQLLIEFLSDGGHINGTKEKPTSCEFFL